MYSIGKLAAEVKLSRSALLYYDKIGLLSPSGRSQAGYRLYNEKDRERLQLICQYRESGLELAEIKRLMQAERNTTGQILQEQYQRLAEQVRSLKQQQNNILAMLGQPQLQENTFAMTKGQWTSILAACGMSDEDMWQWHKEFEAAQPDAHQAFLLSLSLSQEEVAAIRKKSSA